MTEPTAAATDPQAATDPSTGLVSYTVDLDAMFGELEPARPPFAFAFGGVRFTLPADQDLLAIAALEGGRIDEGLRRLLGADQYLALQAVPKVFGKAQWEAVMRGYRRHLGVQPGESKGSTA